MSNTGRFPFGACCTRLVVYFGVEQRYCGFVAGSDAKQGEDEFFIDCGVIAYRKRGRQVLSSFVELIVAALPAVRGAFDASHAEPESFLARGDEIAAVAATQFCISCAYECARVHYGSKQGSLFVDALFQQFFKKLPDDELFQRYLEVPLLPRTEHNASPQRKGDNPPPFSRIFQFAQDMIGLPSFGATVILNPAATQLILDGKTVLEASDPEGTATDLATSFVQRLMERLAALDKQWPVR